MGGLRGGGGDDRDLPTLDGVCLLTNKNGPWIKDGSKVGTSNLRPHDRLMVTTVSEERTGGWHSSMKK